MARKKRKKSYTSTNILFAVLFAIASIVVTIFMLSSLRKDIDDYAWMIEDPNQPKQTMPMRATPTPASTPKSTAAPIETPYQTGDEAEPDDTVTNGTNE